MKNKIAKNTISLAIFHVAKILFPFIVLPYLTRVLTTESYGVVAYVKTTMIYLQVLVDFGFVLSATKDIVRAKNDKLKINKIVSDTVLARTILATIGLIVTLILGLALPILRENLVYTVLSYAPIFLSIYLMDFLFRGIEKMHVITIRFIVMKTISTLLTFVFVKNDSQLMLIPILDILSTVIAIIFVVLEVKKLGVKIKIGSFKKALDSIRESFIYFLSNVASTSFNAFSTIMIGIFLSKTDVAYWGVCMQIIGSIQACYSPLSDGIYPEMIKSKNINILKKAMKTFMPIVMVGSVALIALAKIGLNILGGAKYVEAAPILQLLTPCLVFGFPAIMIGWPALGAIDKNREVTISTVVSVVLNMVALIALAISNNFTLTNIAIARVSADAMLFIIRFYYLRKYKKMFNNYGENKK